MSTAEILDIPTKVDSPALFDRISPRYDFLNHLLSAGMDIRWRRRVAKLAGEARPDVVLDLACGTCDQILAVLKAGDGIKLGCGIDMSEKMLQIGADKVANKHLDDRICLTRADGQDLPLAGDTVDFATISFGIRNLPDPRRGLAEFRRVLKPGGTVAVLEFSLPTSRMVRMVYLFYFRWILPWVGALVSGDSRAYRYLNRTVEGFLHGKEFCAMLTDAGFGQVKMIPLSLGIATIYLGVKHGR